MMSSIAPVVKRISYRSSEPLFQVRILAGAPDCFGASRIRKGSPRSLPTVARDGKPVLKL